MTGAVLAKVATLVRIDYLLGGTRLDEAATHLGPDDRQRARDLLRNQGDSLRTDLRGVLREAYGLARPSEENVLEWSDHLVSLDPALRPRLDVGRSFAETLAHLVDQCFGRCCVEATDLPGRATWNGAGGGLSFAVTRGMREVLLGADPPGVRQSRPAATGLDELRGHHTGHVTDGGTVLCRSGDGDVHWWTWAGSAANRTLQATLGELVDPRQRIGDQILRLRHGSDLSDVTAALTGLDRTAITTPGADAHAVTGLKFSAALPIELARATVGERLGDRQAAAQVLSEPRRRVEL